MKRGKASPTKLDEIVADALRQEAAEFEPMSPALERMVDDGLKRLADYEPEPMSPALERMVEQSADKDATDTPQNASKTKTQKGGETSMTAAARIPTQATNANQKPSLNC